MDHPLASFARPVRLVVEYDGPAGRERKAFTDPIKARTFYRAKFKAGKNPTLRKG